jgi:hypothetical protein
MAMTRRTPSHPRPPEELARHSEPARPTPEAPGEPHATAPPPIPSTMPRATYPPQSREADPPQTREADPPQSSAQASAQPPHRPSSPPAPGDPRRAPGPHGAAIPPQRASKLPFVRQEIVAPTDERSHTPSHPLGKVPRATGNLDGPVPHLPPLFPDPALLPDPPRTESAQLPAVDLDLASSRLRGRGTPAREVTAAEQIRTLVFAPDAARAAWIERELSHAPITIQVGRRIRTIVAALLRDPPPRPDVLVVDFDAIPAAELIELHAIRREGWFGRLIGLGNVAPELRRSLGVDHVLPEPLVRDSLLDCVAGTRHAVTTTACPVIPDWDDHS